VTAPLTADRRSATPPISPVAALRVRWRATSGLRRIPGRSAPCSGRRAGPPPEGPGSRSASSPGLWIVLVVLNGDRPSCSAAVAAHAVSGRWTECH